MAILCYYPMIEAQWIYPAYINSLKHTFVNHTGIQTGNEKHLLVRYVVAQIYNVFYHSDYSCEHLAQMVRTLTVRNETLLKMHI